MSDRSVILATRGLAKEFAAPGGAATLLRLIRARFAGTAARLRALDDINIDVRAGEIVGVIGDNGAGKSTLLRTIAGLYAPTRGQIDRRGDVALLAGLGVGMVDELSVAENIHLYGAICGLSRRTIKARFDEIVGWAELEGFVTAELRTLSTGMRTRLAFSIAMHIDSALVLIDEAFSAGDQRFREKCDRFFRESKHSRRATVVATHSLDFVRDFCDRTLWLRHGRQAAFGATSEVLAEYLESVAE
jgi:ABC-type polysaccharide/polyol phosphate transport system ATPase subunit